MDEFLDEMDDEQVDDLLQPEEGEDKAPQLYEHFRFVADRGQSLLRVDKFLVDRTSVSSTELSATKFFCSIYCLECRVPVVLWRTANL